MFKRIKGSSEHVVSEITVKSQYEDWWMGNVSTRRGLTQRLALSGVTHFLESVCITYCLTYVFSLFVLLLCFMYLYINVILVSAEYHLDLILL